MQEQFTFEKITLNNIAIIKPIWEELNRLHYTDSIYFKDHFHNFTFEKRAAYFHKKNENEIFIEIVKTEEGTAIGYCISTTNGTTGEIDSICITEKYRGNKLGEKLIKNGVKWLKSKNCSTIKLGVSYGHEVVFGFYEKLGFYPRMTYLELKE
jgi:diamine N-acetyltransferase